MARDAHRALHADEDLAHIFTLQETRRITAQLTVHYKRDLYVLEDSVENRRLRGATALLSEAEDGTLTIRANGRVLASQLYPKDQARLAPGAVVDHKRLDGVFAWLAAQRRERDAARLANPKLTLRDKADPGRRRGAVTSPGEKRTSLLGAERTFLLCFDMKAP